MKLITSLDQHELGLRDPADRPVDHVRLAARAVLRDQGGRVAVMYFTKNGSYKLPGGGIDEGEEIEAALRREVREEAGYEITNISELGVVEEDRYCVGLHQTSYCFTVTATKFVGTDLDEGEAADGMELRWFNDVDGAIAAIEGNSRIDVYSTVFGLQMITHRDIAILREANERLTRN